MYIDPAWFKKRTKPTWQGPDWFDPVQPHLLPAYKKEQKRQHDEYIKEWGAVCMKHAGCDIKGCEGRNLK